MTVDETILYVVDLVLIFPLVWFYSYIFAGAITFKGASYDMSLPWPWCWLLLAWLAVVILRLTGTVSA